MKNYRMKYFLLCVLIFTKHMIAQPLPLSEENKALYAAVTNLIHVVPFDDGQTKGFLFCDMVQVAVAKGDSMNWSEEESIIYLRNFILGNGVVHDKGFLINARHWILPDDQINMRFERWSDKKLLNKWDQIVATEVENQALWLSYILELWKRGFLVKIACEDGELLLIDPIFIPYRVYPYPRM
jgi:hypothetical protein